MHLYNVFHLTAFKFQLLMDEVEMLFQIYKGKIQPKFRQSVANWRAEHLFPHALLCSLKTKSLK